MFIFNTLAEKRSSLANPTQWLIDYFAGRESKSGVKVDEESALYCTAVYACIRLLSNTLASLPLILYKRLDRGKERAKTHPVYRLLHDRPNPEMPSYIFRQTLMAHILIYGNAYAQIVRNGRGNIVQLWPLRPDKMTVERDEKTKELVYTYEGVNPAKTFKKDEIFHIPGLGYDGIQGYSSIKLLNEAIGLSLATEQFGAMFFGEGTHPSGVITMPSDKTLGKDPNPTFLKSLKEGFSGLGKSNKLMVLEDGMKLDLVGVDPEKAQAIETRQHQVTEIARFYGVQPHMIGDLSRATNNNIEEQGLEFVIYTLRPWLVCWEQYSNMQVLSDNDQKDYFFEFLIDGLLRGDSKAKAEYYSKAINTGWFSINDILELENRNPIEGGDRHFIQQGMMPLDKVDEVLENQGESSNSMPEQDQKNIKSAYKRLFYDALNRIKWRENVDFERIKQKDELENGLESYYSEVPDYLEKNLLPIYLSYFEAKKGYLDPADEQKAHDLCRSFCNKHIKNVINRLKQGEDYEISEMAGFLFEGDEKL